MGRQEELLKVQKQIHDLRLLIIEFDEIKFKRDRLFKSILKNLGKIAKKDLEKQLQVDQTAFYKRGGKKWTSEYSMQWLMQCFEVISKSK